MLEKNGCTKAALSEPETANFKREEDIKEMSRTQRVREMAYESYINNTLAGVGTHALNLTANTMTALSRIPETYLDTAISKLMIDPASRKSFAAANAEATGLLNGFMNGFRYVGKLGVNKAMNTGRGAEDVLEELNMPVELYRNMKLESTQSMWGSKAFGTSGVLGHASDVLGNIVNLPGNLLNTADVFFKITNYQASLYKNLTQDGVNGGLTGQALSDHVVSGFKAKPADIRMKEIKEAEYYTFTNRPASKTQNLVLSHAFNDSPLLKWIMPFRRTVFNVLSYGVERMPVVGMLNPSVAKLYDTPGGLATIASRQITGGLVMAGSAMYLKDVLHGPGPRNRRQRELWEQDGWREDTLQIGDNYIPLEMLGGYGELMKVMAHYTDWMSNTSEFDTEMERYQDANGKSQVKTFQKFAHPFVNVLFNSHWAANLADFMRHVTGAVENSDYDGFMYWAERNLGHVMPVFGSRFLTNEVIHRTKPGVQGYQQTGDYLQSSIFGMEELFDFTRELMPGLVDVTKTVSKYNMFGDEIRHKDFVGAGWFSEAYDPTDPENKVAAVMKELDIDIPRLRRYSSASLPNGDVKTFQYNKQEWEAVQILSGKGLPSDPGQPPTPTLQEALTQVMESKAFNGQSKLMKQTDVRYVISEYQKAAGQFVKSHPAFSIAGRIEQAKLLQLKYL